MKVLHVYKTYLPENFTGIPRVIWQIAEGTQPFGVESHVLSVGKTPTSEPHMIGSHFSHQAKRDAHIASTSLSFSVFSQFRTLLQDADIVHYHFPWPVADLLHLSSKVNKPTLVTYHSDVVKQKFLKNLYQPLMHRFLSSVTHIVATSPNYVKTSKVLCHYSDKTSIIPLGMEVRKMPSATSIERWKKQVGSGFFLFVGALRYYKGLKYLVEAARLNNLPVVIAGSGDDRQQLEQTAPCNVRFVGEISDEDKEALLSLSRAFVFPSHVRSEAFGLSLLEAARAGKPMISCEIGTGTSYVNADGETGIVIAPKDIEALAAAMKELAINSDRAETMGVAAKARFEDMFIADKMSASYLQLYKQLAEGKSKRGT